MIAWPGDGVSWNTCTPGRWAAVCVSVSACGGLGCPLERRKSQRDEEEAGDCLGKETEAEVKRKEAVTKLPRVLLTTVFRSLEKVTIKIY